MSAPQPALGLYVHWPYCSKICPYCDFNVRPDKGQDTDFLVDAICADMIGQHEQMDHPRALRSLSFGGGTPSRLHAGQMARIIDMAERVFGFAASIEISLEANPTDMETARYAAFANLGVNRLSLGLQSLSDAHLQVLGRDHDAARGQNALDAARSAFDLVSADFIYGLPGQTTQAWDWELDAILALKLDHLSLYCLTIEPKTAFYLRQKRNELIVPSDDEMADLYDQTQTRTNAAGLTGYEISNHAANTQNQAQHNLLYWRGADWIGVGPGAHGRFAIAGKRRGLATICRPQDYANAVQQNKWGVAEAEVLSPGDDLAERLLLGLRLAGGIDLDQMQTRAGAALNPKRIKAAIEDQMIQIQDGKLIANTPLLVDQIALHLLD